MRAVAGGAPPCSLGVQVAAVGRACGRGLPGSSPARPLGDRPLHQAAHLGIVEAEAEHDALALSFAAHYLLALQRLEVARGAGLRQPDIPSEVADAAFAEQEQGHELESGWIAEAGHEAALARFVINHCT